jgi:hypothetical protein
MLNHAIDNQFLKRIPGGAREKHINIYIFIHIYILLQAVPELNLQSARRELSTRCQTRANSLCISCFLLVHFLRQLGENQMVPKSTFIFNHSCMQTTFNDSSFIIFL